MEIEYAIRRLAEINCAGEMMELGEDLLDERRILFDFLKVSGIVEPTWGDQGGFHFTGDQANDNKQTYLDAFDNF